MSFFLLNLLAKVRKSLFFKNMMVVMAGTGIAQVIGFALSPVVSRLFTPSDFGISASFGVLATIIAAGVTLGYDPAIMLPKEKDKAFNLFSLSVLCTVSVAFICMLFTLIFPKTITGLIKIPGSWPLALLILTVLVAGFNLSCQAWAVRSKAFRATSTSQVIRSVTTNGSRITLGFLRFGAPGLIFSSMLGDLVASVNLVRVVLPDLRAMRHRVQWRTIKQLAKEYRDFPAYSGTQNVINSLSAGVPVFLLTRYFGIPVAGAYAFGLTVLTTPMGFITSALRQVLFQRASESLHHNESLATLYVKITATLFALSLVPTVILVIWAPQIFSLIFGSKWFFAGELARSLILWMAVVFCNLPAVLFMRIIRIQRFALFFELTLLFARTSALAIGGMLLNARQTVMLFSLVGAAMNAFLIFYVGRAVIKKEGAGSLDILKEMLASD